MPAMKAIASAAANEEPGSPLPDHLCTYCVKIVIIGPVFNQRKVLPKFAKTSIILSVPLSIDIALIHPSDMILL